MSGQNSVGEFKSLLEKLGDEAHGCAKLEEIRDFLKTHKKTTPRVQLHEAVVLCAPILWEKKKSKVWNSEEERKKNHFDLLQGDIVETTFVLTIRGNYSLQEHNRWLVITPDCDLLRMPLCSVCPIYQVTSENKNKVVIQGLTLADTLAYSSKLSMSGVYCLPPIPKYDTQKESKIIGHVCDLSVPAFIENHHFSKAKRLASHTYLGWHLLNAMLMHKHTRAKNMKEQEKLRS